MSVRVEDRGEGKFDTLTKALKLAAYTVNITDNKKVFVPEHGKSIEEIVFLASDIYHKTRVANEIKFLNSKELFDDRRELQNEAIKECGKLISKIYVAKLTFHLRNKRVVYWIGMVEEVQRLLRAWRDSDADRFRRKR